MAERQSTLEGVGLSWLRRANGILKQLPVLNISILLVVYFARLMAPLVALPLLAQRLTGDGYGQFMFTLSLAIWLALFVEYGFNISSTRDIAAGAQEAVLREIVKGTQSARALVFLAGIPLYALVVGLTPMLGPRNIHWALAAYLVAFLNGAIPLYYFQGKERLRMVGYLELAAAGVFLGGVYLCVRSPADAFVAVLVYATSRFMVFMILTRLMARDCGWATVAKPDMAVGYQYLRRGLHLFIFQAAVSVYTSFNTVLLGFFASASEVGIYATAERIIRAVVGVMGQVSFALFPRLAALRNGREALASRLRLIVLVAMVAIATLSALIISQAAPYLSQVLLHRQDVLLIDFIRTLVYALPAIAVSNVLGFQFLILEHKERLFNGLILTTAVLSLVAALVVVPGHRGIGLAAVWVATECLIAAGCVALVLITNIFSKKV